MTTVKPIKTPDDLNTRSLFFAELAINMINEHPSPGLGAVQWSILADVFEMAIKDERQRCIDDVLSAWSPSSLPEEHAAWKCCQTTIHQKIRARDPQKGEVQTQERRKA